MEQMCTDFEFSAFVTFLLIIKIRIYLKFYLTDSAYFTRFKIILFEFLERKVVFDIFFCQVLTVFYSVDLMISHLLFLWFPFDLYIWYWIVFSDNQSFIEGRVMILIYSENKIGFLTSSHFPDVLND
jgi:hypothetical protein